MSKIDEVYVDENQLGFLAMLLYEDFTGLEWSELSHQEQKRYVDSFKEYFDAGQLILPDKGGVVTFSVDPTWIQDAAMTIFTLLASKGIDATFSSISAFLKAKAKKKEETN